MKTKLPSMEQNGLGNSTLQTLPMEMAQQWQLSKIVEQALSNLGRDGVFTWGEFQTFLFLAANLANERAIDAEKTA